MKIIDVVPSMVQALDINRNELILVQLWGENRDKIMLDRFSIEIAKVGGIPFQMQYSREFLKEYFSTVSAYNLDFPPRYFEIFKPFTTIVDIMTYPPTPPDDFPKDKLPQYTMYMEQLFKTLGQTRTVQIKLPTPENAQAVGVEFKLFEEVIVNALNIDYQKLKHNCNVLLRLFKSAQTITIHTDYDRKLSFGIQGRRWIVDDCTTDMPGGEIYIAPVEESVYGEILIPEIKVENRMFNDVIMRFDRGKLVESSCPELMKHLESIPGGSDIFAEFGIGLNQGITEKLNYFPIDKKTFGLTHVSLGNNQKSGGIVTSSSRMDFLFTPFMMEVDREIIMEFGEFDQDLGLEIF